MLKHKLLAIGAVIAGLLLPAQAMAAYEAYTGADLNLRVGPATNYGVIDIIPYGEPVTVLGCLEDYYWCDVEWFGLRGWVAAEYLMQPGTSVYLPRVAPQLALPIVVFSFNSYHDRHYRDRPWYKHRSGRWRGRDWRRDHARERPRYERRRDRREVERPRRQRVEQRRERQRIEQSQTRQRVIREDRKLIEQRQRQRREVAKPRPQRSEQRRERSRGEQRRERSRVEQRRERPRAEQRQQRSRALQRTERPRKAKSQRARQREVQRQRRQ